MKTVLCYGDSLTWGYSAERLVRHASRIAGRACCRRRLARGAVIAEGLNGRTTAFDDHLADADRNGARLLPTMLATHAPLDLVIIMLGTNDMKPFICGRRHRHQAGMERLVEIVRGHAYPLGATAPQVLIVSPPPLSRDGGCRISPRCSMAASRNRRSWPASIAMSPTSMAAASSTPARSPGQRRSTASISTLKTPGRSARRWRRWCGRCWRL